ncbi:B-cell receptor-associated protein 31-like-domain-containing protein [Radiomyces spectabilis]|uniref:B-cell receptor-associated protein 31-like-domain-containing protein n=1 Tax=Radiomyces spectabilis TaxID=64574 RepID=UPI00221F322E|nr:B-cell receptor-associated protein 31-like-domain-containing protein [Radiomyces spectabilis]KAI8371779.1 B-cell receptor-associated protein 31-like-domain-containing protein [Radiomyces spectabilis]
MTLYYAIVFLILAVEVFTFFLLMIPFPTQWKKAVYRWMKTSPMVAHARYILRIVFGFIFVLFLDAINRLKTINEAVQTEDDAGSPLATHDIRAEAGLAAKKFYAQRNMYLTGFTLLLLLILNHTRDLIVDNMRLDDEIYRLRLVHEGKMTEEEAEKEAFDPPVQKRVIRSTPADEKKQV